MWTSSVLVEPNQFSSHTRDIRSSRLTTSPACEIRSASRSNSLRLSWSSAPSSCARRAAGSTVSGPTIDRGRRLVGRGRARAPQHCAQARDHLRAAERLDDIVVGAELEADDPVGLGPARGEHDHRHVGGAAQLAQHVAPVAVGQHEVEQHDVRRRSRAARASASATVRAGTALEALALERARERLEYRALVLDEEDARAIGVVTSGHGSGRIARQSRLCRGLTRGWRALGGPVAKVGVVPTPPR